MSNDTMPCGCEGHADNEDLCQCPALKKETQRLRSDVERLTRELVAARESADDWKTCAELENTERDMAVRNFDTCERMRAEWKARAEAAEADNAALRSLLQDGLTSPESDDAWADRVIAMVATPHPGAALLEERRRIAMTLDSVDVPSEVDEAEKGRACDFAGRVELLATWGQRGWREYRKTKDEETQVRRMHEANVEAGARVAAEFDKVGVGNPKDGVLTRALALLERLLAAEKVCAAARRVDTFEDFSEPVVAGIDGAPDSPEAMNEARAALAAALRAYDALKEEA